MVSLQITTAGLVLITVKDSGAGMEQEVVDRVFDPFFTTRNRTEGRGLGLSMAHRTLTDHNGHISVDSVAGEGTTVILELPQETEVSP